MNLADELRIVYNRLDEVIPADERAALKGMDPGNLGILDLSFGTWIQNYFRLGRENDLTQAFHADGVEDPEAMASHVIRGYWIYLHLGREGRRAADVEDEEAPE